MRGFGCYLPLNDSPPHPSLLPFCFNCICGCILLYCIVVYCILPFLDVLQLCCICIILYLHYTYSVIVLCLYCLLYLYCICTVFVLYLYCICAVFVMYSASISSGSTPHPSLPPERVTPAHWLVAPPGQSTSSCQVIILSF